MPHKITTEALRQLYRDCYVCGGLGFNASENANPSSNTTCRACQGTGRVLITAKET